MSFVGRRLTQNAGRSGFPNSAPSFAKAIKGKQR